MRAAQAEEPVLSLSKEPAVALAFAPACPFVCHSAARRRNLLSAIVHGGWLCPESETHRHFDRSVSRTCEPSSGEICFSTSTSQPAPRLGKPWSPQHLPSS